MTNEFDELTAEQTVSVFENDETIYRTLQHIAEDEQELDEYHNPIITGDSDTDELLEDERIAQEDQAIDQIINKKRGK